MNLFKTILISVVSVICTCQLFNTNVPNFVPVLWICIDNISITRFYDVVVPGYMIKSINNDDNNNIGSLTVTRPGA